MQNHRKLLIERHASLCMAQAKAWFIGRECREFKEISEYRD